MKIAIQGHPTRGKEVIQILKDLGGKTREDLTGRRLSQYYFINCNGDIDLNLRINLLNHKLYTLEEFEQEFPFKVGNEVIKKNDGKIGTIIKRYNPYMYGEMWDYDILYMVKFNDDPMPHRCSVQELKPYKEMKEERNITLTLDKAKEWYKKGGELKEIALQAFTEQELNPLPRSWEEYCRKYEYTCLSTRYTNIPLKYDALLKLEQLRDCWRQGWVPNWLDDNEMKYVIIGWKDKSLVRTASVTHSFLSFPNYILALEFQKCFKDLIEKAGDLI